MIDIMRWSLHQIPATKAPKMLERRDGMWVLYEDHEKALTASNALIEEQAARIATLEKERDEAREWEGKYKGDLDVMCDWHDEEKARATVAEARLSEAVKVLEEVVNAFDDGCCNAGIPGWDNMRMDRARTSAKAFIATLGEK